jgi:hypothetical protein
MLALQIECSLTWAGPPLSIDDPGILEFGQFEFITAVTMTTVNDGDLHELPLLDISVGLVQNYVQASVGLAHVYVAPDGERSERHFRNPEVGLKFRLVNSRRLQAAFAPAYVFGVSRSAAEKSVGDTANVVTLPINVEYQLTNRWRLNGELGYAHFDDGRGEWGYGVAVAHNFAERLELLFELSGVMVNFLDGDLMQVRAGIDSSLSESLHLLFSIGTGVRARVPEDRIDLEIYLGFKLLR